MYFWSYNRMPCYQLKERYKPQIIYHVNKLKSRVTYMYIAMCFQCGLNTIKPAIESYVFDLQVPSEHIQTVSCVFHV
jgi:hypothetical protein